MAANRPSSMQVCIKLRSCELGSSSLYEVKDGTSIQLADGRMEPQVFDYVFGEEAGNREVFDQMGQHIVRACVLGVNGTIFTYGPKNSGKTCTMMGDCQNPGIMELCAKYIFELIAKENRHFFVRASYIEIYNEKVNDLLNKRNQDLRILDAPNGTAMVKSEECEITSEDDLIRVINLGNKERSAHSHAILRVFIESYATDRKNSKIQSILSLMDLAGAERLNVDSPTGSRNSGGVHINKSLMFLTNLVKNLADNKYISFRICKLTRFLQASLSGKAFTSIICTMKPWLYDESQATLNFAMHARKIRTNKAETTKEHSTPKKELATAMNEKTDTPIKERETPVKEHGTSAKERDTSIKERGTSIKKKETPVKESDTSGKKRGTPIKKDTPVKENGTPVKERDTSIKHGTPIKKKETPVKEHGTPVKERDTSIKERGTPTKKKTVTPVKKHGIQAKERDTSIKESDNTIKKSDNAIKELDTPISENDTQIMERQDSEKKEQSQVKDEEIEIGSGEPQLNRRYESLPDIQTFNDETQQDLSPVISTMSSLLRRSKWPPMQPFYFKKSSTPEDDIAPNTDDDVVQIQLIETMQENDVPPQVKPQAKKKLFVDKLSTSQEVKPVNSETNEGQLKVMEIFQENDLSSQEETEFIKGNYVDNPVTYQEETPLGHDTDEAPLQLMEAFQEDDLPSQEEPQAITGNYLDSSLTVQEEINRNYDADVIQPLANQIMEIFMKTDLSPKKKSQAMAAYILNTMNKPPDSPYVVQHLTNVTDSIQNMNTSMQSNFSRIFETIEQSESRNQTQLISERDARIAELEMSLLKSTHDLELLKQIKANEIDAIKMECMENIQQIEIETRAKYEAYIQEWNANKEKLLRFEELSKVADSSQTEEDFQGTFKKMEDTNVELENRVITLQQKLLQAEENQKQKHAIHSTELEKVRADLKAQIKKAEDERKMAFDQLVSSQEEYTRFKEERWAQLEALSNEHRDIMAFWQHEKQAIQVKYDQLAARSQELDEEKSALQASNEEASAQNSKLKHQLDVLSKQKEAEKSDFEEKLQSLSAGNSGLKEELQNARLEADSLQHLVEENEDLKLSLSQAADEYSKLRVMVGSLQTDLLDYENEMSDHELETDKLRAELQSVQEAKDAANAELCAKTTQLEAFTLEMSTKAVEFENELAALKIIIIELKNENHQQQVANNELRVDLKTVQKANETAKLELEALTRKLSIKTAEFEDEVADLNTSIKELRDLNYKLDKDNHNLKDKLKDQMEQGQKLCTEFEEMKTRLEEQLRNQGAEASRKLMAKDQEVANGLQQIGELSEDCESLRNLLKTRTKTLLREKEVLETQLSQLSETVQAQERKISTLKRNESRKAKILAEQQASDAEHEVWRQEAAAQKLVADAANTKFVKLLKQFEEAEAAWKSNKTKLINEISSMTATISSLLDDKRNLEEKQCNLYEKIEKLEDEIAALHAIIINRCGSPNEPNRRGARGEREPRRRPSVSPSPRGSNSHQKPSSSGKTLEKSRQSAVRSNMRNAAHDVFRLQLEACEPSGSDEDQPQNEEQGGEEPAEAEGPPEEEPTNQEDPMNQEDPTNQEDPAAQH